MAESKRFQLNIEDVKRVAKNALIFAAPAILLLAADLVKALPEWLNGPWLLVALWVVNSLVDVLRKFISGR